MNSVVLHGKAVNKMRPSEFCHSERSEESYLLLTEGEKSGTADFASY